MDGVNVEWVYSDGGDTFKTVLNTLIKYKRSLKRFSKDSKNLIIITLKNRNRILEFMIIEKKPGSWTVKNHFNSKGKLYEVVSDESKRLGVKLFSYSRLKKDRL